MEKSSGFPTPVAQYHVLSFAQTATEHIQEKTTKMKRLTGLIMSRDLCQTMSKSKKTGMENGII